MNQPFGAGPSQDRIATMHQRMAGRRPSEFLAGGDNPFDLVRVVACFDDQGSGKDFVPFIHIEYGFVYGGSGTDERHPDSMDGRYDSYQRVGMTYETFDKIVTAYLDRRTGGRS